MLHIHTEYTDTHFSSHPGLGFTVCLYPLFIGSTLRTIPSLQAELIHEYTCLKNCFLYLAQPTPLNSRGGGLLEWRQSMKSLLLAALYLLNYTTPGTDLWNCSFCVCVCPGLEKATFTCTGAFSCNCFRILTLFSPLPLTLFHLHYCLEIQCLVILISIFQHYLYFLSFVLFCFVTEPRFGCLPLESQY